MAYTPINWQTGDTITAEKMNKMDNGWGVESTQLFSETVTTEDTGEGYSMVALTYSTLISASTIIVTLNGTDYTCPKIDSEGDFFYGGFNNGPDFTNYPFFISSGGGVSNLITQTAGTFNVSVSVQSPETSESFNSAVAFAQEFPVVSGVTTFQEVVDAFKSGKHVYVIDDSQDNKTYHLPIILINERTYEIKFIVTTNSDTDVILSGLSASSADGVIS